MARTRTKRIEELAARAEKLGYHATVCAFAHFLGGLTELSETPAVLMMFSAKEILNGLERAVKCGEGWDADAKAKAKTLANQEKGPVWQN